MYHIDKMAYNQSRKWQKQLLPDDLDEDYRAAHARTFMLGARVRDDSIRDAVAKLKDCSAEVGYALSDKDAERGMRTMELVVDDLNQRIGERLRKLDDTERMELG